MGKRTGKRRTISETEIELVVYIEKCKVLETRLKEIENEQKEHKQTILKLENRLTKIKLLSDKELT